MNVRRITPCHTQSKKKNKNTAHLIWDGERWNTYSRFGSDDIFKCERLSKVFEFLMMQARTQSKPYNTRNIS